MGLESPLVQSLAVALVVGAASGSIGAFIVLKRMALVGDALSHVALPGIALALAYGIDPFWGVIVFLVAAAFIVWWLEGKTYLPTDALVGLLFTASLAVGILTIPDREILESLFGAFPAFSPLVFALVIGTASVVTGLSFLFARKFLFTVTSPDLAKVYGVGEYYTLFLLLIFVFIVALGIKLVGTLLMGALTIIPAAIAKNVSRSMRGYMVSAAVLGGGVAVLGVGVAERIQLLPGPTIILIGTALFLASLAIVRK